MKHTYKHSIETEYEASRVRNGVSRWHYLMVYFCFLLLCMSPLSASTVRATGTGNTLEEAKLSAQLELASQLSVRVTSQQRLISSDRVQEEKSQKEDFLYQDTNVKVNLELIGVLYENQQRKGSNYTITAYLDEKTSLPQYLDRLATLKKSIEEIESRNLSQATLETKKYNLLMLLNTYEQFEAYSTIARALKSEVVLPTLTKTKAGAELDYWDILHQEENLLETNLNELQASGNTSIANLAARQEAQTKMLELSERLQSNRLAMQAWEREEKLRQQEVFERASMDMQSSIKMMTEQAGKLRDANPIRPKSNDPSVLIEHIEQQKQTYRKIESDLSNQIAVQARPVVSGIDNEIRALETAPFRAAEMVGSKVTEEAKALRNKKIADLKAKRMKETEELKAKLEGSVQKQLDDILSSLYKEIQSLEAKSFALKTLQDDITVKVGTYDGYRKSWPVAIRIHVLGNQLAFDVYIPYTAITGNALPDLSPSDDKEMQAYEQYLNQVDIFEAFFSSVALPLLVEAEYAVKTSNSPSAYTLGIRSVKLFRTDTQALVYTYKPESSKETSLTYQYTPSTNIQKELDVLFEKERRKEAKQLERKALFDDPRLNYRNDVTVHLGFANGALIEPGITNQFSGSSFSLEAYYTPIRSLYVGMSIENHSIGVEQNDTYLPARESGGLLAIVGGIYPFLIGEDIILKPYADIRLGFGETIPMFLTLGVGYRNKQFPLLFELDTRFQLSGTNAGLWAMSLGMSLLDIWDVMNI